MISFKVLMSIYRVGNLILKLLVYVFIFVMFACMYDLLVNQIGFFDGASIKNYKERIDILFNRKWEFIWLAIYGVSAAVITEILRFSLGQIPFYASIQEWDDNNEINPILKYHLRNFLREHKKIKLCYLSYFYNLSVRQIGVDSFHKKRGSLTRFLSLK